MSRTKINFDEYFKKYAKMMLMVCRTHGYISKHPYGAQQDFTHCPYCGSVLLEPIFDSSEEKKIYKGEEDV